MDFIKCTCLCLYSIMCVLAIVKGAHDSRNQQIVPDSRHVQESPRLRTRLHLWPVGILPTRSGVRRNLSSIRPNSSIFHHQLPTRIFLGARTPVRVPSAAVPLPERSLPERPSIFAVPSLTDELLHRQTLESSTPVSDRRLIVNAAKNPFDAGDSVFMNSARDLSTESISLQRNQNSLLKLLEERRPVLRDEHDAFLIRNHLTELNVRNSLRSSADKRLQDQVDYIESIVDADIRREVLKIFVKDIVEKSGFVNMDPSAVHDLSSLQALVDKIQKITDRFTNNQNKNIIFTEVASVTDRINSTPSPDMFRTTTIRDNSRVEADLRRRIELALSTYDRTARVPDTRVLDTRAQTMDIQTFQGRPSIGKSIFARPAQVTTPSQSITTGVKRGTNTEPMGGDGTYWTHLRSGLSDMLCNLCQQRGVESCIRRYCMNDVIESWMMSQTQTETTTTRTL